MSNNTNMNVSSLSTEPVYVSFRIENPVTGEEDLSAATVRIALVKFNPVEADWLTGAIEASTWVAPDGETYYVASATVVGSALQLGVVQVWIEITHNAYTYVQRTGSATVY
jgi:hypothetical protein